MTGDTATIVIAVLEFVTALGIAGFWLTWFRQSHDEPWLPDGYVSHERAFVWSDSVLASVLVVAAVLQLSEVAVGASLGLVAGGMLAFLGVLDLAYFAREGMFASERDGVMNAGVVGALAMSVILIVRFA